jgi:tetratricopeptide (TPR) repeat protein
MGKTWTLTEVARRLVEEGEVLIGYYEAKGGESSHLLYAVSNLYAGWLADSAMREQALSLWERHKAGLVPKAARLVGTLFEKLGKPFTPDGIASIVRDAFLGLVDAQKDLASGGLLLAPLPYDQALSLTKLVAKVSERRIVLILDAWEKSGSIRDEAKTLDSFLGCLDDWPSTHVLAAVRSPDVIGGQPQEPDRIARDLCRHSRAAVVELDAMDLQAPDEQERLATRLRSTVAATRTEATQHLLDLVAGYPGVLKFWIDASTPTGTHSRTGLRTEADRAHSLRYIELERLLAGLKEPYATLAARLALHPRLSVETWHEFRELFVDSAEHKLVDELIDNGVLDDQPIPTYGHDTRHAAAMRWFLEHRPPLARRSLERLVQGLASAITGLNASSLHRYEGLIALTEPARAASVGPGAMAALDAAEAAFGGDACMRQDFVGDCQQLLRAIPAALPLVATALVSRGSNKGARGDSDGQIADYTAAIELPGAKPEHVALALAYRGFAKFHLGDSDGEIADYTAAIELPGAPPEQAAHLLVIRAKRRGDLGDSDSEVADYTAAIELPGARPEQVAEALVSRGIENGQRADTNGAIADCTAAIGLPGAQPEVVARGLFIRGMAKGELGDSDGEIADYTAAIELVGAKPEHVALALAYRGFAKFHLGDSDGAIADYTPAIELHSAQPELVAMALFSRGFAKFHLGDSDGAITDYTAAIELPGASPKQVAKALINRGLAKGHLGDTDGAIADYTGAIELPDAPTDIVEAARAKRAKLAATRTPYAS